MLILSLQQNVTIWNEYATNGNVIIKDVKKFISPDLNGECACVTYANEHVGFVRKKQAWLDLMDP